jgi:hypothetical protein
MKDAAFDQTVFINGPFDPVHAPLLEAAIFCVVYFGLMPRLANERLEAGENRLDKIVQMISIDRGRRIFPNEHAVRVWH